MKERCRSAVEEQFLAAPTMERWRLLAEFVEMTDDVISASYLSALVAVSNGCEGAAAAAGSMEDVFYKMWAGMRITEVTTNDC